MKGPILQTEKAEGVPMFADAAGLNPSAGLKKLFLEELKDIYWAEKALTGILPKLVDKTSSEELADGILDQLGQTLNHITRLERIFSSIGIKAEAAKCETMSALINDAEIIISNTLEGQHRDIGILAIVKRIEYYEIASYGILCSFSKTLGEIEALSLLEDTLQEEREAYKAMAMIGRVLMNASSEEQDSSYLKQSA
jgi:ferritin-like metal-binding protein YciE